MLHAIGFDLGTSGLKAVLVDERGRVVRSARQCYALQTPAAGWAEQDPEAWWRALLAASRTLLDGGPAPDAIGLAGQMHSAVLLGPEHVPLRPAILWNDQRTVRECAEINERTGDALVRWTGNPVRTAFTATKLLWLRRHHPDLYGRLCAILLPKDFLRLRLTGVLATDVTDASGTGLFDVHRRQWSSAALDAFAIEQAWLPPAHESATVVGRVDGRAGASGLPDGVPVVAGAGDQAAAALGSGAVDLGALSITLGTSATVQWRSATPKIDSEALFQTFCHAMPDSWQLLAAVLSGGGSLDWYHHLSRGSESPAKLEAIDQGAGLERLCGLAAAVPPGAEGLLFLPYLTGEAAPHLDPEARGAWFGLTRRHDHRHLARAVIEGVAFAMRGVVEAAEELDGSAREVRVSGGGSQGSIWLQTLANVLGRPLVVAGSGDASARGAALLALSGLTSTDVRRLASAWSAPGRPIEPQPETLARYERQYAIFRELYPATRHLMHRLGELDRTREPSSEASDRVR